jgi:hypothetical protein
MVSMSALDKEGDAAVRDADYKAKTHIANATHRAGAAKREGELIESNARAARAAGGGAYDAGAEERQAKIKERTDYNVMSAMFEGEQSAQMAKYQGEVIKKATKAKKLSTVLSGASQAFSAYSARAPGSAPENG